MLRHPRLPISLTFTCYPSRPAEPLTDTRACTSLGHSPRVIQRKPKRCLARQAGMVGALLGLGPYSTKSQRLHRSLNLGSISGDRPGYVPIWSAAHGCVRTSVLLLHIYRLPRSSEKDHCIDHCIFPRAHKLTGSYPARRCTMRVDRRVRTPMEANVVERKLMGNIMAYFRTYTLGTKREGLRLDEEHKEVGDG
jgi:hypothetical protein